MRILQYMSHMRRELGGPIRAVLDLSAGLAAMGHEVTLASDVDRDVPEEWKHAQVTWPRAASIAQLAAQRAQGRPIGKLLALESLVEQADLVHMHEVWSLTNVRLGRICQRLGKPYVISVRGVLDDWCMQQRAVKKRLFLALVGRRHLERAAAVHLTALFEHHQARRHFPRGRGVVVPNLLDLSPYTELPGADLARAAFAPLRTGQPVVLFLSRIHFKKGIENLLRAAAVLNGRGVAAQFIIAGHGDPSYVAQAQRLAVALGVSDRAHFVGPVVDQRKVSLYQAADLFVLPTSQENFGFVFPEAMACRTPVVTTKGVDIWPELESSGGACITSPEPAELARVIQELLGDPQRRSRMGEAGRQWVFSALDPGRVLQQFDAMYQTCLGGPAPARTRARATA